MRYISIIIVLFLFALSSWSQGSDDKRTSANLETSDNGPEESIRNTKEPVATSDEVFSETDSPDWDVLLDSYEQYVDQYISYVKKAVMGDMDALAEYPSFMQKAQELGEKMEKAKGDMYASQLAKYQKITMKMAEAAQ